MSAASNALTDQIPGHIPRATICLSDISRDTVIHKEDAGFSEALQQYYVSPESNASEQLIALKAKLRLASTHDFWTIVLQEICEITGSQCGFVSKRILVDDQNTAVEMPTLGEPGSCLMGIGFYLTPRDSCSGTMYHDYKYHAYGTPCAHMKHDKVFIIPERMTEFIRNNPNTFPWKSEAYIAVPLFSHEGKCFAHFGMIWSEQGAKKRKLSWGFIEMFLHSLEDMILRRILLGQGFAKEPVPEDQAKIIPLDAITASQSLKPYARSLSHELRTPMQGVVGMLDIMYSTVVGSMANQPLEHVRSIFQDLRENIEQAQDSSKRAVEAADAVVHAYDLNMQMPDTPLASPLGSTGTNSSMEESQKSRPGIVIEGSGIPMSPKRKASDNHDFHGGPALKKLALRNETELFRVYDENLEKSRATNKSDWIETKGRQKERMSSPGPARTSIECNSPRTIIDELNPTHRHINTRDFLQRVVSQAFENGHPERKIHTSSDLGESIEVRTRGPKGNAIDKTISLIVDNDVPETIVAEESVLELALHKVIDNAIKFTDFGTIIISVSISAFTPSPLLEIRISDQGCGITPSAQANLFKPFSQQDASMSRQKEGLGMGLYIAKARTRQNLGGDMILEKSETEGLNRGSRFLIRLPMFSTDEDIPPLIGTPNSSSHKYSSPQRMLTPQQTTMRDALLGSKRRGDKGLPSVHSAPSTPLRRSPNPRTTLKSLPNLNLNLNLKLNQSPNPNIKSDNNNMTPYNKYLSKEHPLTFLVAEDNALNRKLLLKCLSSLGYASSSVLVAVDGVEAVELFKCSLASGERKKIDVVLMDLWMPNLDGYGATKRILEMWREWREWRSLGPGEEGRDMRGAGKGEGDGKERDERERGEEEPVIMAVTADITSESQERAKEVGMKGFMSKPYKVIDVQNLIREHFRRRRGL